MLRMYSEKFSLALGEHDFAPAPGDARSAFGSDFGTARLMNTMEKLGAVSQGQQGAT